MAGERMGATVEALMKRTWLLAFVLLAFACDDQPDPPPPDMAADVGPDAGQFDGGGDGDVPDSMVDPDTGADVSVEPDVGGDMAVEADTGADAALDLGPDAAADLGPDAALDMTVDAELDAALDQGPDAAPDMAPDPDLGPDAEPDMAPIPDMAPVPDMAPDVGPGPLGVEITAPVDGALLAASPVEVRGAVVLPVDALTVAGLAVAPAADGTFTIELPLDEGPNEIVAVATRGGEQAEARVTVTLDTTAPVIVITAPEDGARLGDAEVEVTGTVDDPDAAITVAGVRVQNDGGAFAATVPLPAGETEIVVRARDAAGNTGEARVTVQSDRDGPVIQITAPVAGLVAGAAEVEVRGLTEPGAGVVVFGAEGEVVPEVDAGGAFTAMVTLIPGANRITATATDAVGNQANASVEVFRDATPPVVTITQPIDGAVLGAETVRVRGTVDDRAATLTVDDQPVAIAANGTFTVVLPVPEGETTIVAVATDAVGNEGRAEVTVTRDAAAPTLEIVSPEDGLRTNAASVEVRGTIDDPEATVTVAGVAAVVADGGFTATVPLDEGDNAIIATARDAVGNEVTAQITVIRDITPPVVRIDSPADGVIVGAATITISGTVDDPDGTVATVTVNGVEGPVVDGAYSVEIPLQNGNNGIAVVAVDGAGNEGSAAITIMRDSVAPVVSILVPADGATLIRRQVRATGTIDDPLATVVVGGVQATVQAGRWVADVTLAEGESTLEAVATDRAGNEGRAQITITVDSTPADIVITEPADGFETGDDTITVRGRVQGDDVALVEIDGVAVAVAPDGSFERAGITLEEGSNIIVATVTDTFGNVGLARVQVIRDAGAPVIHIETPADGDVLTTTQIDVAGITNDYITGITVGEDDLDVWVNGQPAMVLNRTFTLPDLLLQRGPNTITVEAEDRAGNRSSKSIEVTVVDEAGQRLVLISGQSQGARQGEPLRDPLTVSLLDENGNPVPETPVTFTVTRGDGSLEAFPETGRELVVETDDNGLASVAFTPGGRSGAGSHRVRATAPGFLGAVEFCTSVYPDDAVQVVDVAGENQMGQTATRLPQPLVALVTDPAGNPVEGVDVTFAVQQGGAAFFGEGGEGEAQIVVPTDGDGLARATPTLGGEPGRMVVQATIAALEDPATQGAVWRAETLAPGERAATRVVGQVLDNQDAPIPGVTAYIRLEEGPIISAETDDEGQFVIDDAPVGAVHLVIEGETALREGEWPRLTYDIITVAGVDNDIGKPIYLPELAPENAATVGGAEDVTLLMDGVPGATLTVFANSVTCIDGERQCEIVWSQVRGERVPDPAPMGSTFDMVATLQPPGVRFDPPARVCIPNRGNPPGYQQEMFAYDHDLGDWVGIGTGSVTADGQQICTDTGFGLHKSGWHGAPPPPPPPRCPSNCDNGNPCETGSCQDGSCVYEPKADGTRCDDRSGCGEAECQGGSCQFNSMEEDGTECDDNDECTQMSQCEGGACVGSDPLDCEDDNECTEDSCDPLQGCQNEPKAEGQTCEPAGGAEDNECIEGYACQGGSCEPKEKECEQDDNPCTEHTCEETGRPRGRGPTRCAEKPVKEGESCREAGPGDEQCGEYTCQEGMCEPAEGQENTNEQECDDENECTENDRCQAGECKGDERPKDKVEGGLQINLSRDIDRLADVMERLINRVPFLQASFGTGGAFGIKGSREDCCNEQDGTFVDFGKRSLTGSFQVGASIRGTLPGLGILESFEVGSGSNRVSFSIAVGIIADLGLNFTGSASYSEDQCLGEEGCTTIEGKLELSGGLSATASVEACVEVGIFSISVCPNVTITPARLVASASGSCAARFGNCGDNPTCNFTFGELKFVAEINYYFDVFTYERVLYGGL